MSALTSTLPSDVRSAAKDLSRWSSSSSNDLTNPEIQDAFARGLHGIAQSYAGASAADRAYFRDRMYGALRGVTGVDDQPLLTKSGVSHDKTTLDDQRRKFADGMYSVVKSHRDDLESLRDKGDTKTLGWYADTVRDWAKTYGFDETHTESSKTDSKSRSRSKKRRNRNQDDTTLATTKGPSKYKYPNAGMQPTKSALKSSRRTDGDASDIGSRSETEDGGKSSKRRRKEGASEGKSTRHKRSRAKQRKEASEQSERSENSQSHSKSEVDLRSTSPSKLSIIAVPLPLPLEGGWGRYSARLGRSIGVQVPRSPRERRPQRSLEEARFLENEGQLELGLGLGLQQQQRKAISITITSQEDRIGCFRSHLEVGLGVQVQVEVWLQTLDDSTEEDNSLRGGSQTKSRKSPKSRKDRKRKPRAESAESHSSQSDATDSEDSAASSKALVSHSAGPRAESIPDTQIGTVTGVTSADIESMVAAEVQKRLAQALAVDSHPAHPLGYQLGAQYPPNTPFGQNIRSQYGQYNYPLAGYSASNLHPTMGDTWTGHAQITQQQLANTGYFNPEQVSRIMHESSRRPYVSPSDFKSHAREVITRNFGSSTDGGRTGEFEDHHGNKARGRKYLEAGGTVTTIDYDYDHDAGSVPSPGGAAMAARGVYPGGAHALRSGYDHSMTGYPQSLASGFAPSMSRSFVAPTVY